MEKELAQALETFMTECGELLEEMEAALLNLEDIPGDSESINSLFRAAHTIKGSSGILGLEDVERFTHTVENLLTRVRDGEMGLSGDTVGLLLECRDHIAVLVGCCANSSTIPDEVAVTGRDLTARLDSILGSGPEAGGSEDRCDGDSAEGDESYGQHTENDAWHISLRFGPDVFRCGMDPASFVRYLVEMGEVTSMTTVFESMPEAPEMDPESCYLGFEIDIRTEFGKNDIAEVFEFVSEDCTLHILPPHTRISSYVELIQSLPEDAVLLGDILVSGGALTQSELDEALRLQSSGASGADDGEGEKRLIGEIMVDEKMVHPEVLDAALDKQKQAQKTMAREKTTIRIDAGKLDTLINLVGELVISGANVNQQAHRVEDGPLIESTSLMSRLVEEIRDNAMQIRMVPIGDTFSRFKRVVRDVSRELDKEISLQISGGDTELDKTIIERISDPLMHLVRNAADHGLEKPEERTAAGKPSCGTIRLNAYQDAGSIVIDVCDDGKGLSKMRILDKAFEQGLVSPSQQLSDREIYRLIFEPGFSTAGQVTKISGRGVGMDVVRQNIEALRGTVEVESDEGAGTTVSIRLPLTMAIIDGFLVSVGESPYVIPLDMVVECVELPEQERLNSRSSGYINLRGEALPYLRLSDFFGVGRAKAAFENVVIVQYAGQKTGLVVDGLFGEVQTVIKSLGAVYKDVRGVSGATIMGDGRVALIIDVPRMVQSIEEELGAEAV